MNNDWTYEKVKEKILMNEQTKLVNSISQMIGEIRGDYLEIINNEGEYNEDTDEYGDDIEVYGWILINGYYNDLLEYGEDNIIYTEFKGQKWIGLVSGNSGWNMDSNIQKLVDLMNSQ